jgi:hypothetical protein
MASKREQLVKVERVEVLPSEVQPVALSLAEAKLHAVVQQQLAEALAQKDGILIEPFFRPRRIAEEIRRLQIVPERKKWSIYYDKWGCLRCGTNSRQHASHGMCLRCTVQIIQRLKEIVRELRGEKEHPIPRACEDCGRRFPAMTDSKWESVYEQHKISRKHNRKVLHPAEGAVARSCALCEKYFHPMSRITWNHVRQQHERGYRHRLALRKRKAR